MVGDDELRVVFQETVAACMTVIKLSVFHKVHMNASASTTYLLPNLQPATRLLYHPSQHR